MTAATGTAAPRDLDVALPARRRGDARTRWAFRFLAAVAVLSFLTPLLPLAAPDAVRLDDALRAPSLVDPIRRGFDPARMRGLGPVARGLVAARTVLFGDRYLAPVLGTDELGRCVLSRIAWGSRVSLLVALVASVLSLLVGVAYGSVAGFAGRRVGNAMMRVVDVLYALPLMFIVIFVVAMLRGIRKEHPDLAVDQLTVLFLVIGAVSWLNMARSVRAQTLLLKSMPFVDAARCSGLGAAAILWRHIIPNTLPVVVVALTLTVPRVILFEAFLSFLGLGVEAPDVSWGLLARQGYDALTAVHASWWLVLFPGAALAAALLAMNLLGDALRDRLDPRR